MEALFNPPRYIFNNNSYDNNLNIQHETLKRIMNSFENLPNLHTDEAEEKTIIEKMPPPIKIKRRTKKDIKDLIS